MNFMLNPEVAKQLEVHFDTVCLECLVGQVPPEQYERVEQVIHRSVRETESVAIRVEGSLATLQVTDEEMEKKYIFSISVADALGLIHSPQRVLRMLVSVGQGIVIDKSDERSEIFAVPACEVSQAFLQLVALPE